MDYTKLDWTTIVNNASENIDTKQALLDAARIANSWNGSCDWADVFPMEEFNEVVTVDDPYRFASDIANGGFNPGQDYFYYDNLGWLSSCDEIDLLENAWDNRCDVISEALSQNEVAESLYNSGAFDIPDDDEDTEG